ncbi:MAG: hypothetical protein PVI65_00860, partial [Desulfobacterales bacterium]
LHWVTSARARLKITYHFRHRKEPIWEGNRSTAKHQLKKPEEFFQILAMYYTESVTRVISVTRWIPVPDDL